MDCCIYETDSDYKARVVIDVLKEENILTYSVNMGLQNLYGDSKLWTGSDLIVGEIKIYVKEEDYEKAKQIIEETTFLKNDFKTIEDDKVKKDTYIIQRSFLFSAASLLIIPFFFNLEYVIYCFKNNLKAKYILLLANVFCLVFSIVLCLGSFEYIKSIWKWNFLITSLFCIGKGITLYKKKSKLVYILLIPIILLILSYVIAEMHGIKLFV